MLSKQKAAAKKANQAAAKKANQAAAKEANQAANQAKPKESPIITKSTLRFGLKYKTKEPDHSKTEEPDHSFAKLLEDDLIRLDDSILRNSQDISNKNKYQPILNKLKEYDDINSHLALAISIALNSLESFNSLPEEKQNDEDANR